ncbi:MAG: MotA/TolQ/ExbB proton channel family protein [Candidatus Wallbacteria bacterium]|nr:MotA/TolQ/ExbB proton channel family protein [Candidatus Wallbacteria bacterium]
MQMTFLDYLKMGAVFMYPMLALSVLTVCVMIERYFYFRGLETSYHDLDESLKKGHLETRQKRYQDFAAGGCKNSEQEEIFWEDEYRQNTRYFGVLYFAASTAPLIGLLGTISGIIKMFRAISVTGYHTDPSFLATGIWEALVTTFTGILIAIPATAMLQYFDLKNRDALLRLRKIFSNRN